MSPEQEIDAILQRLDASEPDRWLAQYRESLRKLRDLRSAAPALQAFAEQLERLDTPKVSDEWKLCLLLTALVPQRPASALAIAEAVIAKPGSRLKAEYVRLVDSVEGPGANEVLVRLLNGPDRDGLDDDARAELIRSLELRGVTEARSAMSRYLDASEAKVRHAAIRYLFEQDALEVGGLLVGRIPIEEDPDVLQIMITTLVAWQQRSAVPALQELRDSDWAHNDEDVAEMISQGIAQLT
jgi:hypothetical protein